MFAVYHIFIIQYTIILILSNFLIILEILLTLFNFQDLLIIISIHLLNSFFSVKALGHHIFLI